jgi:hypothetical protein
MTHAPFLAAALAAAIGGMVGSSAALANDASPTSLAVRACATYADLRSMLIERFGEELASTGVADDGTLMQVFASDATDTWTMVRIQPDGGACVLAVGRHWPRRQAPVHGLPA